MRTLTTHAAALVCVALLASLPGAREARAQETEASRAAARAVEARKAPAAKGSISGRVVGEGGEPLPHIAVHVRLRGVSANTFRALSLTTDEEGAFVARDLAPGAYVVWASIQGYVPDPEQLNATQGHRLGDFVVLRLMRGGVITGTVTDASGQPLPALGVSVLRVRDHEGRPTPGPGTTGVPAQTDDRGVYRIYGLMPGSYIVVAGNSATAWGPYTAYEGDAPTYFPSAGRDTAAEVTVRAGQEVAGIDIRYREERGRRISGTLVLPPQSPTDTGVSLLLSQAGTGAWAGATWVNLMEGTQGFSLDGVADGDYELQAQLMTREGIASSSAPLRVAVRGADVTGLKLTLAPLANASGTLTVEPAPESLRALPECKERAASMLPQEALVVARRDARASSQPNGRNPQLREFAPEESGAFTMRNLEPGAYRFEARPVDENFYARPFQLPQAAPAPARPAAPRTAPALAGRTPGVVNLSAGQQLSGLSVRLAAGAAGVAGRVAAVEDASAPPVAFSALRVHLVPAERERADETSAYAEVTPGPDGTFTFKNLAPGRYLFVARPLDMTEFPPRPAAWDADARARLRREAEAAGVALDLRPCQRVADFTLRYPQTPGKQAPGGR